MSYIKLVLSVACFISFLLGVCYAKPTNARLFETLNKPIKNNFLDILGKRGQRKCEGLLGNDVDLKAFNDEVAYAFLSSGNIEGLDELLRYLVDLECFSLEETLTFRYTLITIYDLINTHKTQKDDSKNYAKRESTRFDYFKKLNTFIDEIDFALKNGNEKSFELIKYLVEYIMVLEESNNLNNQQANILLEKLKTIISTKNESNEKTELEKEKKTITNK